MSPRREVIVSADGDGTPSVGEGSSRGIVDPSLNRDWDHDASNENLLRPTRLSEFIGQRDLVKRIGIVLEAARLRNQPVDHFLFG